MPDRVNLANVTCAAGVLFTAPIEVVFATFAPGIPRRVSIVIPDGHAGLTGIALGFGHQPVIPDDAGQFISGNDETLTLELTSYPAGPQWSAFVCNIDTIPHTWQVRFEFDELRTPQPVSIVTPLDTADIVAAGNAALSSP